MPCRDTLYFVAGINGEQDGLLGSIRLAKSGHRSQDFTTPAAAALDQLFAQPSQAAHHPVDADQAHTLGQRERPTPAPTAAMPNSASNSAAGLEAGHHLQAAAAKDAATNVPEALESSLDR